MSATAVGKLSGCIKKGGVSTLVLDGMKLSGSDALTALLGMRGYMFYNKLGVSNRFHYVFTQKSIGCKSVFVLTFTKDMGTLSGMNSLIM